MSKEEIEKLARWYCTLNGWNYPEDMPNKPDGWDDMPEIIRDGESYRPNKYDMTGGIMKGIEKLIGHKETLRWHHLNNLSRTDNEFEKWWETHYGT